MREFGYAFGDQPGLDDVTRTDLLLDALAKRDDFDLDNAHDLHDHALAALLGEWRDDLRWPPASALVSQDEAVEALIAGIDERRRARRALAAVGSVAATLLALSGFGALVADARPGDALYGLHAMIFNEPRVNDDQILLSAKADLAKVEQMIAQGQWVQAQTQLAEVSSTLQAVNDGNRRQNLLAEVNQLNTKVEKRDPNATLPPSSPPQSGLVAPANSPANSVTPMAPETESPTAPSPSVSDSPTASVAPESTSPTVSPSATSPAPTTGSPEPKPGRAPGPSSTPSTGVSAEATSPTTTSPTA
ncbi:Anti-sigma-D factor RsdA [Mycobacterium simulans]|uniref:anti-sigma-D factor RsdA n=1 Tax=Mycobacterium simulans TaxID=627089 RepID=UPI00174A9046|nr:anti-sigma-D factor RsdA [Mycobacterium simulans]SON58711.1 Anti-sigma-D factor RsdA [Mycobacterium simulans]